MEAQQQSQDVIENERQELVKYQEEKNNEILSYNNQLAGTTVRRYEHNERYSVVFQTILIISY